MNLHSEDPLLHLLADSSFAKEWKAVLQQLLAATTNTHSSAESQIRRIAFVKKRLLLELLQDSCMLNGKPALEAFAKQLETTDQAESLASPHLYQAISKELDNRIRTLQMMLPPNSSLSISESILHHRKALVQQAMQMHLEFFTSNMHHCASILRRLTVLHQQMEQTLHSAHLIAAYKNKSVENLTYLMLLVQNTAHRTRRLRERLQAQLFSADNLETLKQVKVQLACAVQSKKLHLETNRRLLHKFEALGPSFARVAQQVLEKRERILQVRKEISLFSTEKA